MKIDMLSMAVNNSVNNDNKTEKSEIGFLSILENEVDNISFKEIKDEEVKDELLQIIYSLISKLNINNDVDSKKIKELDAIIERVNPEILSELNTKSNEDKMATVLNDINLNSSEIKLINNKLDEIINRALESVSKEIKDINKSSLLIKDNSNAEIKFVEAIKKILENNLNKESNGSTVENLINNNFKQIQYVEDNYLDKDKNILLKISKGHSDTILKSKDIESSEDLNILNNISNLEKKIIESTADIKPVEIRSGYIADDIGQAIRYLKNNEIEDLTLKINPKELGELTIKLIKSKGENKVIITSSSNETFKLINENIKDIEKHLINLDIKLNQVSVEIKNYGQGDFAGDLNQQFNRNSSKDGKKNTFIKEEILEEEINKVSEDTNINLLI